MPRHRSEQPAAPFAARARTILSCALLSVAACAGAQSAQAFVGACGGGDACVGAEVGVGFDGVRERGSTISFSVSNRSLRLFLGAAETFGPLGNVVFELDSRLVEGPRGSLGLGARGVIANVAARARLSWASHASATIDPFTVMTTDRMEGGARWTLSLGATYRPSRTVVLDLAPTLHSWQDGFGTVTGATLRLLRAVGDQELRVLASVGLLPGDGDHVALGGALHVPRGSDPDLTFAALVGLGPDGVRPGFGVDLAERLPGGASVELAARYEGYRTDVPRLRGIGSVTVPLDPFAVTARLDGSVWLDARSSAASWHLRLSVSRPLNAR